MTDPRTTRISPQFLRLLILLATSAHILAAPVQKPAKTVLQPGHDPHRIAVKFRDGLNVRLRNGVLVSSDPQLFSKSRRLFDTLSSGKWERADAISEDAIDQMRGRAEQRLGRALPDLNLQFYLAVPPGADPGALIDSLNQLDIVELAQPVPRAAPPPLPPNFQPRQTNYQAAPIGDGVSSIWADYGVFGNGLQVADVEYSFNADHADLPKIVNLSPDAVNPLPDNNHGTATLGEISAMNNAWGTTGISYGATFYFAGAQYQGGYNVGQGIITAASQLKEGDILLIEQQLDGPNTTQDVINNGGEFGCVPVEWFAPYYDRIVMAVGQGINVIEAGGNGGQNLDDPIYRTGNSGHWPFLPQNDSGAIIVGAGASFNGSSTESSRLDFSNFGSRVDVQEWGENIVTTGYGDLYDSEGSNYYYTATFGGTSGATPIVVGEAALLQSIYQNATGQLLAPSQIKMFLRNTGSPQKAGAYTAFENIGPHINLSLAVTTALSNSGPPVIVTHTTNVTELVGGTATLMVAAAGAQPMTYQWQFFSTNLTDGINVFGSSNADLVLNNLNAGRAGIYTVTVSNSAGITNATAVLSITNDPSLTPGVALTNLYTFTGESDGSGPVGLTTDGAGHFYGMQEFGGSNGYGGIFEFTPASSFSVLYSFSNGVDGAYPVASLAAGRDGEFYGATSSGGAGSSGTIFSVSASGALHPLYAFTGGTDGGTPHGTLVEGTNQLFYGTASTGGTGNGYGVIFTVGASGNYSVIHPFDYTDGSTPYGGLVLAGDGNFYGTTYYGGTSDDGTVFRITPAKTFSSLHSFNGTGGSFPTDSLAQGLDGKLYGRTYSGGAHAFGTVFSITTKGTFQLLYSFKGTDGANPYGALLAGNDGNLYGLSEYGGANGQDGVIYEVTPTGAFDIVANFDGRTGMSAYSPMVRGIDGKFYGATFGGSYGYGVIFRLSFASTPPPDVLSATGINGQFNLTWNSVPGRSYQVQFTTNLSQPNWTPLSPSTTASATLSSATDVLSSNSQSFYRVNLSLP